MITFRLLGPLHLTDAAGREVRSLLTRPRRLALLAYLAAATPRSLHRRDNLLARFWPELDQEHARAALRQALHVLRSALGPDVVVTRGDEEIGLDFARLWCDVAAFDDAIAGGRFAEALDCYRGPLLDGFFISAAGEFEQWLDGERARLQRTATRGARALADESEAKGDIRAAAEWAHRATQLAPLDEESHRRLITLLDRLGDRAGAVEAYEGFVRRLSADLETEPAAETKALVAAVRARDTAAPVELRSVARAGVTEVSTAAPSHRRRRALWLGLFSAGLLGLLLVFNAGGWRGRVWPRGTTSRSRSLAVMPLENFSGDSLQGWFADGMTEALITDLGRIPDLRVVSRGAVLRFQGRPTPLREIGNTLHVDAVVEGGVQRSGNRVRVDLRLIDVESGYQLWAGRIEEPVESRFAIEDSVSHSVAVALKLNLTSAESRQLSTPPTDNAEAYDLYLRGKIRIRRESREDDSVTIVLLEQAVALDPAFAAAYAQLARAYALRVSQFAPDDSIARERAYFAGDKALELNADLAETHWAMGQLLWGLSRDFSSEQAIREDRRAVALNPNLGEAHQHLGLIYLHVGLVNDAVAEFEKALALNPFDANARRRIGIAQIYQGRYADGYATFRQVGPEANPALWTYQVAWALLYLGRDADASAIMEDYLRVHPEDRGGVVRSTRAILRAKTGDLAGATADIERAVESGKGFIHFHHSAYNIASAYAILRRPGPALEWLKVASGTGWPCYPYFANDPNLANIRDDPGFVAFLHDLKAQWERYRAMR